MANSGSQPSWSLRVVENKYPALTPVAGYHEALKNGQSSNNAETFHETLQLKSEIEAIGHHEVVIESPHHNHCMALNNVSSVEDLVFAWKERGRELAQDPWVRHIIYFKNCGGGSGASLVHPHSQIVAMPVVPDLEVRLQKRARDWFERTGVSIFDHIMKTEVEAAHISSDAPYLDHLMGCSDGEEVSTNGHRIVDLNPDFMAMVPFAAISPFYLRIIPRYPGAHFHDGVNEPQQLSRLAEILHRFICAALFAAMLALYLTHGSHFSRKYAKQVHATTPFCPERA